MLRYNWRVWQQTLPWAGATAASLQPVLGTWRWPQAPKPQLLHHEPLACVPTAFLPSCIPLHAANTVQLLVKRRFAKGRETENK